MKSTELPPICQDGEHKWAFFGVHGCGALPDDQATDEALVLVSPTNNPGPEAACQRCFQLWEEKQGKRHSGLEAAYRALSAW